jgi:Ran GTPase-activating protein (RanGAP) involved in mRNA processing and transport
LSNDQIEHLQLQNIGGKPGAANFISYALRDPSVAWKYLDVSGNSFSRSGLNQIFWSMKSNRRIRIFKCSENKAGTLFSSNMDTLLSHGISVPVTIRNNTVLKELDLSFNSLVSEAGINILDALIDNHTLKKVSLRGNLLDDAIAKWLPDLFRCNEVLEELDLGCNKLSLESAIAIADSLESNRTLKCLILDHNNFGGVTKELEVLEVFCRSLMLNYTLQILIFDCNKLGPEWGIRLAETFARNNTLLQVSLKDNRFDSRAGNALYSAFKNSQFLLELTLSPNEVGQQLWEAFRIEFERKRASTEPGTLREEVNLTPKQREILLSYH